MPKDNWIKALGKYGITIGAGEHSEYGYFLNEKEVLSLLTKVEKDAIEKTNKRWREKIGGRKLVSFKTDGVEGSLEKEIKYQVNKSLSDLLEDKK